MIREYFWTSVLPGREVKNSVQPPETPQTGEANSSPCLSPGGWKVHPLGKMGGRSCLYKRFCPSPTFLRSHIENLRTDKEGGLNTLTSV